MDNLIDNSYFWGGLKLTTTATALTGTPSQRSISGSDEMLNMDIAKYQLEFLTKLFGSDVAPESVLPILLNETLKMSPIANYVFCKIAETRTEAIAGSQYKKEGSEINNDYVRAKYLQAWNQMVRTCKTINKYMVDNSLDTTYPTDSTADIYELILC